MCRVDLVLMLVAICLVARQPLCHGSRKWRRGGRFGGDRVSDVSMDTLSINFVRKVAGIRRLQQLQTRAESAQNFKTAAGGSPSSATEATNTRYWGNDFRHPDAFAATKGS
jgi:hypothetical protein